MVRFNTSLYYRVQIDLEAALVLQHAVADSGMDSDEVVQLYMKQPHATHPAPRTRLVDFARVHIPSGQSIEVALAFAPKDQAVVAGSTGVYRPDIVVEAGVVELYVGGGQPGHYAGVVMKPLTITAHGALNRDYKCSERH
eukprot:SAG31_NODE_8583_length_1426_cov_1.272796_2_plen_140_part_00